jgi:hypothetical protein
LAKKLASHVFETEDPEEWKQLANYADGKGMFIQIQVQPAERVDRSQLHGKTRVFMIPKRYACHFEDTPEKYGLFNFSGASGQKAPSTGPSVLGAFVAGLAGNRRGGARLSRAFAPPKQARQPAVPKPPSPPRALTAAEADQLGNEWSKENIAEFGSAGRARLTPSGMIDYGVDLSTEANEGRKAAAKPAKAGKAAAQTKPPKAKQSRERAEAIDRGEVVPGSRKKKASSVPTENAQARVTLKSRGTPEGQPIPMIRGSTPATL